MYQTYTLIYVRIVMITVKFNFLHPKSYDWYPLAKFLIFMCYNQIKYKNRGVYIVFLGDSMLLKQLISFFVACVGYLIFTKRDKIKAGLTNYGSDVSLYFESNPRVKKWLIIGLIALVIFIVCFVIPGFGWKCDDCGKTWIGSAYHGSEYSETLCRDCAVNYWSPLPIENYKK